MVDIKKTGKSGCESAKNTMEWKGGKTWYFVYILLIDFQKLHSIIEPKKSAGILFVLVYQFIIIYYYREADIILSFAHISFLRKSG